MKYIAFLRAINVGGHSIIKMDKLAKLFSGLKVKNVKTYIQSGNVLFESSDTKDALAGKIEKHLRDSLKYDISVMIRTLAELHDVVNHNPFGKIRQDDTTKAYISFLSEEPNSKSLKSFLSEKSDVVEFKVRKTEIYVLFHKNKAKHPFSNNFIEKKLKVKATTRAVTMLQNLEKLSP